MGKTNFMTLARTLFLGVFAVALIFSFSSCGVRTTHGYASMGVGMNIDVQPIWGPVGYDYVEYYYLPDIDVYYYVPRRQFIYLSNGRWVFSRTLPSRYRNYDLYSSYKVVVNEPTPYRNYKTYREKYQGYRGTQGRKVIRNSNDSKYFVNRNHPEHRKWRKEYGKKKKNDRGNKKNKRDNRDS